MTTQTEALKLALEALERYQVKRQDFERFADVITAIKEALAQPEQEPVAWMYPDALCDRSCLYVCTKAFTQFPECANAPPQRTWVGLTDEEMKQTCYEVCSYDPYTIARAIEAKLKEKNT